MQTSNSKLGSLIVQLHNRTNEAKEAFDQALAELEREKTENEKRYQEQLEQLKEERRKWDEEKATMGKLEASASPIVNLNIGGENMSTSRATLTRAEGSLLATMFSGKWEDKLMKDTNGFIFLDYDPILFKYLLNQLRIWSDPSIKRVFRLPVGSEQSFLEFIRLLKFDERFIDGETSSITSAPKATQPQQLIERFRTASSSDVQLTDNDRRCEKISPTGWQCVFGTLPYSTGQNKPPNGPNFYHTPTTHGWFIHGYVMTNGQGSLPGWPQVSENDILELTIDCDRRSLSIRNEGSQAQNSMQVNINEAPLPWCLLVLLETINSRVSLM